MSAQITVVIPTYNRAHIVAKALESVFAQTHRAAEIIVVNDGSKDDTEQVLASFGSRIRAITQANAGLSGARNTGIRAARTEWVAFLDDDDEYTPDRLAVAAETIHRFPEIDVHATNTAIVSEDGSEVDLFQARGHHATEHMRLDRPLAWILRGSFFAQTLVARKRAIEEVGYFRKTYYEDMDLFIRLAARGPWTIDARRSLRLMRRPGEDLNLSSLWRSKPIENYTALARIHREALEIPGLTPHEIDIVRTGLGTNCFELGRALLTKGSRSEARASFHEAARSFTRTHSRMKSRLCAWFGPTGLSLVSAFEPKRTGLRRSTATG